MTRRRFAGLLLGGLGLSLVSGCAPDQGLRALLGAAERPSGSPSPGGAEAATTRGRTRTILSNENRPGFFVRYYKPFEAVDPASWTLSVEGLVGNPLRLSLQEVRALSGVSQASRMVCVEGWSAAARWGGFKLSSLLQQVAPQEDARWVHFHCADGYTESMRLEELLQERILLAHSMNDQALPDPYGAPLRLIVPPRYGYKGPKAITRMVLAREELRGYWTRGGFYSVAGEILEGWDLPLELGGAPRQIFGGEVRYPDGIEFPG